MIFSDTKNNQIFKCFDGLTSFTRMHLEFKPTEFYFTTDQNVLFASQVSANNTIDVWFLKIFENSFYYLSAYYLIFLSFG